MTATPVATVISADDADRDAAGAAAAARIDVIAATVPDVLDELRETMRAVWGDEVVLPRNVLRGMAIGGAGILIARRDGRPVGFALGWLGWADGVHLHSHQVGVTAAARGSGAGLALKLAQRAQCLRHGVTEMRWTFDPLLATNATFNLVRLGARVVGFLPDCYGARTDAFNTGDVTDRVEVSWQLDRPVGGTWVDPGDRRVVPVPADYLGLRATEPSEADRHRRAVGAALADFVTGAESVAGLTCLDDGVGYVIEADR